jgi:hypothetical protein
MKITYKQYRHAPEQLKIFLNGVLLDKKYYSNLGYKFYQSDNKIRFIRDMLFKKYDVNKKFFYVDYKYINPKYEDYNNKYYGYTLKYDEILKCLEMVKNRVLQDEDYNLYITFNRNKAFERIKKGLLKWIY